jgi:hypothetical protein
LDDVVFLAGFSATAVELDFPQSAFGTTIWRVAVVGRARRLWRCWHCIFGYLGLLWWG